VGPGGSDRNAGARVGAVWMTGGARGVWFGPGLWVGAWRCGRLVGRSQDDKAKLVKKMTFQSFFRLSLDGS
jgi:hypothetical protein